MTLRLFLVQSYQYLKNNFFFIFLVALSTIYYYHLATRPLTQANDLEYWSFVIVGEFWHGVVAHPVTAGVGIIVGIMIQAAIGLLLAYSLRDMYLGIKTGGQSLLKSFRLSDYLFLLLHTFVIMAIFGSIALSFYIPALTAWSANGTDRSLMLVIIYVALFPIYYLLISVTSFVAVLPYTIAMKQNLMRKLLTVKNIAVLYIFYFPRIAVESFALLLGPWLAVQLHSPIAGILLAVIILSWPLAYLRSTSFQVRLRVFAHEPDIARYYTDFFMVSSKPSP